MRPILLVLFVGFVAFRSRSPLLLATLSDFGLRISFGFRTSAFGFQPGVSPLCPTRARYAPTSHPTPTSLAALPSIARGSPRSYSAPQTSPLASTSALALASSAAAPGHNQSSLTTLV